ncbi:MAG: hypothetical protein ACTSPI_01150 [Candidatus Heimdallarchaeaceae archaeon]
MNIRIGKLNEDFYWVTLKKGETIDLPEHIGRNNGLEEIKVTEGKAGPKKVETKQFKDPYTDDDFYKELTKIKGIGVKTAKDIVIWGTKEKLIESIKLNKHIPFRDDVVEKLKRWLAH